MLGIDTVLRTVRKELHGDKVFAANNSELAVLAHGPTVSQARWSGVRLVVGSCKFLLHRRQVAVLGEQVAGVRAARPADAGQATQTDRR